MILSKRQVIRGHLLSFIIPCSLVNSQNICLFFFNFCHIIFTSASRQNSDLTVKSIGFTGVNNNIITIDGSASYKEGNTVHLSLEFTLSVERAGGNAFAYPPAEYMPNNRSGYFSICSRTTGEFVTYGYIRPKSNDDAGTGVSYLRSKDNLPADKYAVFGTYCLK